MQTEAIITTLLDAARFLKQPIRDVGGQAVKDAYEAAKSYLRKILGIDSDGAKALDFATEKPESAFRKAVLVEEADTAGIGADKVLHHLIEDLARTLPEAFRLPRQQVHITGTGNRVNMAGRDIVTAERVVNRNAITPDARHITSAEKRQFRPVISELAYRLAGRDGSPRYSAVHAMLQQRFGVASYLLIPRDRFAEALSFLKQQRAIRRQRLGK